MKTKKYKQSALNVALVGSLIAAFICMAMVFGVALYFREELVLAYGGAIFYLFFIIFIIRLAFFEIRKNYKL